MAQPQPAVDPKAFYGYLFQADKKPTKLLYLLLRGIANYIRENVGDTDDKKLTPAKLASFYKLVGGNYDSLFVEVPHPSISWIYASIGCQHTLQPTENDFTPPSVPALTTKGFVRWQSIEILLGPEEHVPFIQNAVGSFHIKNPETGEVFPVELPKEAFPLKPDAEIERWHSECAAKLRERATPDEEDVSLRPDLPPRPKVQTAYKHVRPEYFAKEPRSRVPTRPIPYQHVPVAAGRAERPKLSRSPDHRARQFLAPEEPLSPRLARARRRSYPENLNSPGTSPTGAPPGPSLRPPEHSHARRHSHPRHPRHGSVSPDASSEDDYDPHLDPSATEPRRRSHPTSYRGVQVEEEVNSPRFGPSVAMPPPPASPRRRLARFHEARDRDEEAKRRSYAIPVDLSGKLSTPFMMDRDRERERERERERDRERDPRSSSKNAGKVSWKDLDFSDMWKRSSKESSQDEHSGHSRHRSSGEDRSDYKRRDRERDREREPRPRPHSRRSSPTPEDILRREREAVPIRPRPHSRRSSPEELPRRERDRDRVRERDLGGRGEGREHRSLRERDRERERERRYESPLRGVDGRKYPSHS
ncbi:hypothetical protein HYALB_00008076 [Hymenoscyphus albidus]|uniref:DUF7514 domain-containing protein n=1 Tax=Hymenoscyphus albidus TaxID=595503 RepID=A0A9N9LMN7_9HELO|nr:hypothetical protein HYALB_00008076 [Hymenoscyphus albidus]